MVGLRTATPAVQLFFTFHRGLASRMRYQTLDLQGLGPKTHALHNNQETAAQHQ